MMVVKKKSKKFKMTIIALIKIFLICLRIKIRKSRKLSGRLLIEELKIRLNKNLWLKSLKRQQKDVEVKPMSKILNKAKDKLPSSKIRKQSRRLLTEMLKPRS